MTSDSENWEQLQALFHLAEDVPDDALDPLLLSACLEPGLRSRAKTLIVAERKGRLESALSVAPAQTGRMGPYTILRHLGSGGIGAVYLVERIVGGVVQRSALKVLSLHATGPFFIDRFAREQHILASLDHPHITRMLDAGISEAGQPYLVMEYVDGVHLDTYCDDRSLGIPERLQLFLGVCEAVAYAHRNLVVHLDLKPSNILVTEAEGNIKLLDFGTSKLIQPDSLLTTTVMATPAYASPEQLLNEPVTTSCDIYALGAILFELLAGRRPNHNSSVAIMIERSMKELPPEPLTEAVTPLAAEHRGLTETRLRSELSGDLATIVAKCLTPRPKDRYTSVDALITDLQRYLAGRPILARPQTTTYRIGKFVRRNRKSVLAATLAILALAATAGYAVWRQEQAIIAGRRALQMQTFMYRLFKLANSSYTGKPTATVTEFLELGVKVVPDFIKEPADLRAAQLSFAESMFDNGDYHDAQPLLNEVIDGAKAAGDIPSEAEAEAFAGNVAYTLDQPQKGRVLAAHALALAHRGTVTPAARIWIEVFYAQNLEETGYRSDENLKLLQAAAQESRTSQLPDREVTFALDALADDVEERGRLDEAESLYRETLAIYNREPYALCDEAIIYRNLGFIRKKRGDLQGSLQFHRQAYEGLKQCSGEGTLQTLAAQGFMAGAMIKLGQAKDAIPMLEQSLPLWRKAVGPDSAHMANPLLFLSQAYVATGDFPKAETTSQELLRVLLGKVNAHSAEMGVSQTVFAQALAGQHRYREASVHAQAAVDAFPETSDPGEKANAEKAKLTLQGIQSELAETPK